MCLLRSFKKLSGSAHLFFTDPRTIEKGKKKLNSLPNDKILDWSKLKAFADGKINREWKIEICLGKLALTT